MNCDSFLTMDANENLHFCTTFHADVQKYVTKQTSAHKRDLEGEANSAKQSSTFKTGERGEDVASMATPYVDIPLGNNNLMELRGVQTTWRKLSSETLKGPVKCVEL
ncbi:hypothetical protein Y1Q_0021219 [Alligator mississippiensis]|uniref:Uncharacterized protein n=1 Tax=Alligator mississippiensis TaxID=8496 RepID=A0A151MS28_ALLMI|nr:hypothetical protein Y1Q_0021219 [Alligator mississippiensis]